MVRGHVLAAIGCCCAEGAAADTGSSAARPTDAAVAVAAVALGTVLPGSSEAVRGLLVLGAASDCSEAEEDGKLNTLAALLLAPAATTAPTAILMSNFRSTGSAVESRDPCP